MAINWIPIETTTPTKREVLAVAKATGISRREAFGCFVDLWIWAQDNSVDGNVDAHVDGNVDAIVDALETLLSFPVGFMRAARDVGWIKITDKITFVKWDRWLSSGAKSRIRKSMRQNKWRAFKGQNVDANVDGKAPTKASPRDRERDRKDITLNPLPPLPANLQTDAFRAAWDEWQKHRKEKRATLTPTAAKRQLAELAEWGEADAIAAIQNSIKNGWQGIFPPKSSENTRKYKQTESGYDADRQLTL